MDNEYRSKARLETTAYESPSVETTRRSRATLIAGILAPLAVVVAAVVTIIPQVSADPPAPPSKGQIASPADGTMVIEGEDVTIEGTLDSVPTGAVVRLETQVGNDSTPLETPAIQPAEHMWARRIALNLPRGTVFDLVLKMRVDGHNDETLDYVHNLSVRPSCDEQLACVVDGIDISDATVSLYSRAPNRNLADYHFVSGPSCGDTHRPVAIQFAWDMQSSGDFGGVMILFGAKTQKYLDLSGRRTLNIAVFGSAGREAFQIALKDSKGTERRIESIRYAVLGAGIRTMIAVPLESYGDIDLSSIRNISFGVNKGHGKGTICIDQIASS